MALFHLDCAGFMLNMVNVLCDVTALPCTGILHDVRGCYNQVFCRIMENVLCDVTALPWRWIPHNVGGCYSQVFCRKLENVLCGVTALPWRWILHNVGGCCSQGFCWMMVNILCDVTALPLARGSGWGSWVCCTWMCSARDWSRSSTLPSSSPHPTCLSKVPAPTFHIPVVSFTDHCSEVTFIFLLQMTVLKKLGPGISSSLYPPPSKTKEKKTKTHKKEKGERERESAFCM